MTGYTELFDTSALCQVRADSQPLRQHIEWWEQRWLDRAAREYAP